MLLKIIESNLINGQNLIPRDFGIEQNSFALMTMHRPSNVDKKEILEPIIRFFT